MKKIKVYELVAERDKYWLNKKVNELIKIGYQPLGNPQITIQPMGNKDFIVFYSQVMVRYEEDS